MRVVARRINFDDDIFFLELRLRHIQQAARLDIDDEPYVGRLIDDLLFIDRCIRSLHAVLDEARQLSARGEHLSQLAALTEEYSVFLSGIRYQTSTLARRLDSEGSAVGGLPEVHAALAESMRGEAAELDAPAADQQQVSPEEMHHLLVDEAEGG